MSAADPRASRAPGWRRSLPLPAAVRLVWHETRPHPRDVPVAELYTDLEFPPPDDTLPYLAVNMIMTLNGEATVAGKAVTIGTPVDSLVLTRLRAASDAVLTGVGTLLAEDVTAALPEAEDGRPHVRAALEALGARGARLVVSEGGPHVFASLLRARVVREYFLTTTPFATGNPRALRPIAGDVAGAGRPLLLARVSRYEHTFQDPATGAHLIEAYERFRVVYPE
jgi:riboflavin biosynthesis pyrimidine reductase